MLEYIYNTDRTSTAEPVEVLKVNMHDKRQRVNPFVEIQAVEIAGTLTENGGTIRFSTIMGLQAATRRNAAPRSNVVEYGNDITTKEIPLSITEPLESPDGKAIPTSRSDVVQMDGINFTPIAASKTANILIDGEILADVDSITLNGSVRIATYDDLSTTPLTELRIATHKAIASYYDVSVENVANWPDANVFAYFDAGRYSYEPAEVFVYANPSDMSDMSIELLFAGQSTSDMVFQEFKEGKVQTINGRPVKATRYVPKGEIWVSAIGVLGRPSNDVIYTLIKTSESDKGDLQTYGKHYYDSILIAPELFTRIIPASALPPLKEQFAKDKTFFDESKVIEMGNNTPDEVKAAVLEEEVKELEAHLSKAKSKEAKERIQKAIANKKELLAPLIK